MKILLVEDDIRLGKATEELLTYEKCVVDWVTEGSQAVDMIKNNQAITPYDVVILDWMLPVMNGIEVCKTIRNRYNFQGGILFVTAKGEEEDCVKALDVGSDDFMVKPVKIKELMARLNALCRRKNKTFVGNVYQKDGYTLLQSQNTVQYKDDVLHLRKKEFAIFEVLFVNIGNIIARKTIFEKVWENNFKSNIESLDSQIYNLRKKLKIWPQIKINLVKNVGYVMEIRK